MAQLPALKPARGNGLAQLGKPSSTGVSIGQMIYARAAPDSSYVPAVGGTVSSAAFPEYAAAMDYPPMLNRELTYSGAVPSGDSYNPHYVLGQGAISDNGEWILCINDNTQAGNLRLYQVINDVVTLAYSLNNITSSSSVKVNELAVSNNGDIAVRIEEAGYLLVYRRSGPGTWAVPGAFVYTNTNKPTALCWTKEGTLLHGSYNGTNYVMTRLAFNGSVMNGIALTGFPTFAANIKYINRNLAGTRYVIAFSTAPFLAIYDYNASTDTFSAVPGPLPAVANQASLTPEITNDGRFLLWTDGITHKVELYVETPGAGFKLAASVAKTSARHAHFCCGDSYILASPYQPEQTSVYKFSETAMTEVSYGQAYPALNTMFGGSMSRDGLTWMTCYQNATFFHVTRPGSPPQKVALPGALSAGSGATQQFPYVKVRP